MKVEIPFQERWREAMLSGRKYCTTRTKPYGQIGDHFEAFGKLFELENVGRVYLGLITFDYYRQEGCFTPQEFEGVWRELHPKKGWDPYQWVYVHQFRKAD